MKDTAWRGNLYVLVGDIGLVFVDGQGEERATALFRDIHKCAVVERRGEKLLVLVTMEGSKEIGIGKGDGAGELRDMVNERARG